MGEGLLSSVISALVTIPFLGLILPDGFGPGGTTVTLSHLQSHCSPLQEAQGGDSSGFMPLVVQEVKALGCSCKDLEKVQISLRT